MSYECRYDIKGLAADLGLPKEDIAALYSELISELCSEVSKLKIVIIEKDLTSVKRIIHNIKGVCGNYRITDVYKETILITEALKMNDYDKVNKLLNNFYITCENSIKEIKSFFLNLNISL